MKLREAERQRKAVEAIEKAGGWVYCAGMAHVSTFGAVPCSQNSMMVKDGKKISEPSACSTSQKRELKES